MPHPPQTMPPFRRLAWLPLPLLLTAIVTLWIADLRAVYESHALLAVCNFLFSTVASLLVAILVGGSYLARPSPSLLLLGVGVLLWGAAGTLVFLLLPYGTNALIAGHNILVWVAAACHLTGSLSFLKAWRPPRKAGLVLALAYVGAAGIVWLVVRLAMEGRLPLFFVQGQGGTPLRTVVLRSTIAMFVLTAALLWRAHRPSPSAFVRGYAMALLLVATGLFGIMLESAHGGALSWTGRAAQFLGGAYMLAAAVASVREVGAWRVTRDMAAWDRRWAAWDDRLLGLFAPRRMGPLSPAWRYGLALALVVAATALRRVLLPAVGAVVPYNFSLLATVLTTLLAGVGPGLLSVLLGDVAVEVFVLGTTTETFHAAVLLRWGTSVAMGIVVVWVLHALRSTVAQSRQSQERLAAFAAATLEGIGESENGRMVDCNEQLARLCGCTVAELKGAAIADLAAPEDRDRVAAFLREKRPSVIEHAIIRKDGKRIVVESHVLPVAPGHPRRFIAVRDITARKDAETALYASELRMQQALRVSRSFTFDWDPGTDRVVRSASCSAILGLRGKEAVQDTGQNFFQRVHPDDRAGFQQTLRALTPAAADYTTEYRVICGDGSEAVLEETGRAEFDASGQLARLVGVSTNITDRKQMEIALRESGQRALSQAAQLQAVLDATPAIIWIARDQACRHIAGNRAALEFSRVPTGTDLSKTGPEPEKLAHYRVFHEGGELAPEDMPLQVVARCGQALRDYAVDFHFDDGTVRSLIGNIVPQLDAQGLPTGAIAAFVDITQRKETEEAIRKAATDLQAANAALLAARRAALNLMDDAILARQEAEAVGVALQASEQLNRRTLQALPAHIAVLDQKGSIINVNLAWTHFARDNGAADSDAVRVGANYLEACRGAAAAKDASAAQALAGIEAVLAGTLDQFTMEYPCHSPQQPRWFLMTVVRFGDHDDSGAVITHLDITTRKQAEERIRTSLVEKEMLLKEIHHRVKNNLQVISSLVSLQTDGQADPAVRTLLGDVRDRVRTMALVHEKLYESGNLSEIDLAEYARSLLHSLWQAHGPMAASVRLTLDLNATTLTAQKVVPCGLLLTELASNALKHAFRGRAGGDVTVRLRSEEEARVRLIFRDNGHGLPPGFDWRESKSLGLRLVRILADQLGAAIDARPVEGGGTAFEVVFEGKP